MTEKIDEVAASFRDAFGTEPEVVASAPGRVNIIGEHIDYNDGWVLPFAIDFRTQVLLRRRDDHIIRLASGIRSGEVLTADGRNLARTGKWIDYPLGVVRELGVESGLDIYVKGDVPTGAGLSSSAALECATASGLNLLFHLGRKRVELALAAQRAENEFVGMPCGIMDQAVSMLATADHALLLDCRSLQTTQIPLNLEAADLRILVIDTRAKHALVDGGYAARRESCEQVAAALQVPALRDIDLNQLLAASSKLDETGFRRARHAVTEMERVHQCVAALEAADFNRVGELLDASHASLRDDYEVSCPELDVAQAAAVAVGALGARMVGGGFGGSAIALVHTGLIPAVKQAVREAYAASGFTPPRFFVARPAAGARAEWLAD